MIKGRYIMPIVLTSNGLTGNQIREYFKKLKYKTVAIIVTADPIYRDQNWKAMSTKEEFNQLGYEVDFIDLEFQSPNQLLKYDILYFNGGNPFYLLHHIRLTNTKIILEKMMQDGKVISGGSAGSVILGQSIALIHEFDPQMNDEVQLEDFTGLNLTDINLCPHFSRYIYRYESFDKRITQFEQNNTIQITRLNDGEAIVLDDEYKITYLV